MAMVELALLLPMLILLLAGILEFGRVLDAWVVVTNAAREGGRYAALSGRSPNPMYPSDIQSVVSSYLVSGFAGRGDVVLPAASDVQVTGGPACWHTNSCPPLPGTRVTVGVQVGVSITIPLIEPFFATNPAGVGGHVTVEVQ